MEVVLDTNILLRTLISKGNILDLLFDHRLVIYAPKKLKEGFYMHEKEIIEKSSLPLEEFNELKEELLSRIIFIDINEYLDYIFKARELLKEHTKDEDFIALCLLKNIKLWTYEERIFNICLGISTKEIKERLAIE